MCYGSDARPPLPPISGGATAGETGELTLEADDGNRFAAYGATAASPGGPGMVILPDVRGLHAFYRELAVRFAEAGIHATAIDYFGRTAGIADRGDDFDWQAHVPRTTPDQIGQDVAAAVAHVRSEPGGGAESVFTVGFCFGGRNSFNQAARGHGLAGVIGFYGRVAPADPSDENAPVRLASRYSCPVLGLFGGADRAISNEDVEAFGGAVDAAGVDKELVIYEGAPHSFFDRSYGQHREACDDAWGRMLAFTGAGE
jgi:carboxymethylenebutenolidase